MDEAKKFDDIRNIPFSEKPQTFKTPPHEVLRTLSFNEKTRFDNPLPAQKLLEAAKEPPFNTRALNQTGLTGKGVFVAMIDQPLALDHPEYKGQIFAYKNFCDPSQTSSMHGPAVASLLAGKTLGTAPDAKIIYAAIPTWEFDATYAVSALDWILEENKKLPENKKIRFVSVSAAFGGIKFKFRQEWTKKVQEVQNSGICVVECTKNNRFVSECYIDPLTGEFKYGYPDEPQEVPCHRPYDKICAPNSMRTTAESYNNKEFGYTYWGFGGLSWAIPYVVGVLALGQQANPALGANELKQMLIKTAKRKVIDPAAFIKEVQKEAAEASKE